MAIPMLKESCFGCCSLQTGSKIIAWISVIISAGISGFSLFIYISRIVDAILRPDEVQLSRYSITYGLIDSLFISLLFIASIVNIIGVYKEKAGYLKPWFICVIIFLFEFTREIIIEIIVAGSWKTDYTVCSIAAFIIVSTVYGFLIEYSYYRIIRSKPLGSAALV